MLKAWLRFFRAVNLPTVPGDVLVGAAMAASGGSCASLASGLEAVSPLWAACLASAFLYLFGLADNDIVGAAKDRGRPIPDGQISLCAARMARGTCLLAALIAASLANLPSLWWITAFALTVAIVLYNRTKLPALMGVCRGLNVGCGCAATSVAFTPGASICMAIWTLYIAAVTKYSEGEEADPAKKQFVGRLIGVLVYLQLFALLAAYLTSPCALTRLLLLAGAGLLIVLRLIKRFLPGVSSS